MADISKITLPQGELYNFKDASARENITRLNTRFAELNAAFTNLANGITLDDNSEFHIGTSDGGAGVNVVDSKVQLVDGNGATVSSIENGTHTITMAEILQSLKLGNYTLFVLADGSVGIAVGG